MLLTGYDTLIGEKYKKIDNVQQTLKTLELMSSLKMTTKDNVYFLDRETDKHVSVLCYPLTFKNLVNKDVTVVDLRPYMNNTGKITNFAEYKLVKLTAALQQDFVEGNVTPVLLHRGFCGIVLGRAMANRLKMKANLDPMEELTVGAIITYYYLLQTQADLSDYKIVILNILKSVKGLDSITYSNIIDEVGVIRNINELIEVLKTYPGLFKLANLTLVDFLTIVNSLSLFSLGKQVVGAMIEFPPLLISFIYTTLTNVQYNKTTIGTALNSKDLKLSADSFVSFINSTYSTYLVQ